MLGLSCGTWVFSYGFSYSFRIFSHGFSYSLGSLVTALGSSSLTRGPGPLHWEHRVFSHWTTKEVLTLTFLKNQMLCKRPVYLGLSDWRHVTSICPFPGNLIKGASTGKLSLL